MYYSLKIEGKATEVYKAYTAGKLWVATIRHYDDKEAVRIILEEYRARVATIIKNEKIIWEDKK